jgi:hypothetical protein
MNKKRSSSEPRTEPRTEPTITPVWLEWEDKLPLTGTNEVVEEGDVDDGVGVGAGVDVIEGESEVRVEGRVGGVAEGSADVEGVAGVEDSADAGEGVAGIEVKGDDAAGEDDPP